MARWWTILGTTWRRMGKDNVSALAAGAAFQTLLTIFPALTAAVSLYGLVADRNMVGRQIMAIQGVLPPEAITLIATWLHALVQAPATRFGLGLIVSVLLALWSIWSATGMLMTAVTVCYGEEEKRGFVSSTFALWHWAPAWRSSVLPRLRLWRCCPLHSPSCRCPTLWARCWGSSAGQFWPGSLSLRLPLSTATPRTGRSQNGSGSVGVQ